jgi:hypothetical protein
VVDHVALSLEQNMQSPIAEAAALLGDRPHALVVRYLMVMRQQLPLHASRSLIP